MKKFLFTKKEATKIINAKKEKVDISLDLGLSLTTIYIKKNFVFIRECKIPLSEFCKVEEGSCYILTEDHLQKLAFFSDETNFYYKLVPTSDWPTVMLSSTPMHRCTLISPKKDVLLKIKEINPVKGKVLDTCCGLGYTAILSSKKADEVYTFERDNNVLYIAKLNPYSQELFRCEKIKIFKEDVFKSIKRFEDCFFDRIIHDPPTFKYAPELYSKEFYLELYRVLKKGGVVYHYMPWPHKTKKKSFYSKVIGKIKECGFKKVVYKKDSSGIRMLKL